MMGPISERLGGQAMRIFVICTAAAVLACASTQSPSGSGSSVDGADGELQELSGVSVEREGEETVILLEGLDSPSYTDFVLEDENVYVVDLPGVKLAEPTSLAAAFAEPGEQVSVYDGLVDQVSTSSFEGGDGSTVVRVEVALATAADLDLQSDEDGLSIRVTAIGAAGEMDDESLADADDPWSESEVADEEAVTDEMLLGTADDAMEAPPAAPATMLSNVSVQPTTGGAVIHLEANGTITSAETFQLEGPDRLVVDLPGLANEVPSKQIDVGTGEVARVRIGTHADKVRVVVDGGAEAAGFEGKRVMPVATGLVLSTGMTPEVDALLAQVVAEADRAPTQLASAAMMDGASATDDIDNAFSAAESGPYMEEAAGGDVMVDESAFAAAPADDEIVEIESDTAEIYGLQYDTNADRDRIAVLSDRTIEYELHTPDSETVVVSIMNARIAQSAAERITPQTGGPVSLITTFQQPDVPGNEVRVVMKRAPELEPMLTRRGSLLFIDFENIGVAAAPPPAFVDGEQQARLAMAEAAPAMEMADDASMTMADGTVEATDGGMVAAAMVEDDDMAVVETMDAAAPAAPAFVEDAVESDWQDEPASAGMMSIGAAAPASLEPPAAVELLEEGGLIDGKEYKGRRISLDFKDVEVADVLRLIAEVSDLNIIAGDEVQGIITIRLVDVPWDQALDVILLTKGLGFVRVGNVLRIAPAEILKVEEEVRLQERRNKEKLEDLEVKLHPVNYANVEDVSKLVKRLLSARGTVNIDERTNTVIIKDISAVIDEATALIQAVDTQTPQVMIEAKIVEAALDFSRELGSVWKVGSQPLVDGFDSGSDPRTDLGSDSFRFQGENSVAVANPITSTATGALTFGAFLLDDKMRVDVQIQAAEATGEGKVISSPRVVTLDNREAIIEQGVSIPFQTFESGDAKLEFIDAVLSLKVTPHITTDRSIIMSLEVTRNAPDASVPTPTGSPAIAKNQAKTETLVKDGQTLVIGGIYTIDKTERETRVPYLHRIPVLGAAFKSRELSDIRKELLIFVTPRIVLNPALATN